MGSGSSVLGMSGLALEWLLVRFLCWLCLGEVEGFVHGGHSVRVCVCICVYVMGLSFRNLA